MKKPLIVLSAFLLFSCKYGNAQVHVDINIGTPVVRTTTPVHEVSYYYLPDVEAYYYVPAKRYYYYDDGVWVSRSYLPGKYRSCNAYSIRHIAVREPRPFRRHEYYRNKYAVKQANYYYKAERVVKIKPHQSNGKGHGRR